MIANDVAGRGSSVGVYPLLFIYHDKIQYNIIVILFKNKYRYCFVRDSLVFCL